MMAPSQRVSVVRVASGRQQTGGDVVAAEEPLEVRLHGRPFAVIMRTPGADRELVAGFLLAERVLLTPDDLGAVAHCTDAGAEHPENVINVLLAGAAVGRVEALLEGRRRVMAHSSCGLCGRQTIEGLKTDVAPLRSPLRVMAEVVSALPGTLRGAQTIFDATGGLHAAGLFAADGALVDAAEDVGRHNAVDKVIGRQIMADALPLSAALLFVSGRTSYEIIQKAALAGIPFVASVSAPSSLAVALAEEIGITLVGFVRGQSFNVYAHPERITTSV